MSVFFWVFYFGGAAFAYDANRKVSGRFGAFIEGLAWPWGLGYGIARQFYHDPDLSAPLQEKEAGE